MKYEEFKSLVAQAQSGVLPDGGYYVVKRGQVLHISNRDFAYYTDGRIWRIFGYNEDLHIIEEGVVDG